MFPANGQEKETLYTDQMDMEFPDGVTQVAQVFAVMLQLVRKVGNAK